MGKQISLEKDLWKVGFDCLDHGLCITTPPPPSLTWNLKMMEPPSSESPFWKWLVFSGELTSREKTSGVYPSNSCFLAAKSASLCWSQWFVYGLWAFFWFQAFVPLPLFAMARVHLENQLPLESDDDDTSDEAKLWEWGWGQCHGWFSKFRTQKPRETVLRAQIFSKHVKVFQQDSNEALPGLGILSHTQVEKPVELRHTHPMRIYDDAFSTKLKSKLFWASCRQSTLFEMSFFSGFKLRFSCWW